VNVINAGGQAPANGRDQRLVDIDDMALIRLVADGDATALKELYERHAPWLFARLMRRCNDREVVMDVIQDCFVAVWNDARKWRGDGEVAAWLWGIGFRRMVSRLRGRKQAVLMPDWDELAVGRSVSVEDQVLVGIEYGNLGGAMTKLSPEMRSVVQSVVLDGLTTKETSRLLGIPENTVKTRLHRAKAHLRQSVIDASAAEGLQ
jgi:RNA polymerase sigma-70 factor (ECF subfamily)